MWQDPHRKGRISGYQTKQEFFIQHKFLPELAERLAGIAILPVWDAFHLFNYASQIPVNGIYVEIGSFVGGSLVCIHEASKIFNNNINITSIDPLIAGEGLTAEEKEKDFHTNTKDIPLKFYKDFSQNIVNKFDDNSIDLLFIDGAHNYDSVKSDIENYFPKVKDGGVMLGHDFNTEHLDVAKAFLDATIPCGLRRLNDSSIVVVRK